MEEIPISPCTLCLNSVEKYCSAVYVLCYGRFVILS